MYYKIEDHTFYTHLYGFLSKNKHTSYPVEDNTIKKIKEYSTLDFYVIITKKGEHCYYSTNIETFIKKINSEYLDPLHENYRIKYLEMCEIIDRLTETDDEEYCDKIMKGYYHLKNIVQHPVYFSNEFIPLVEHTDLFKLLY